MHMDDAGESFRNNNRNEEEIQEFWKENIIQDKKLYENSIKIKKQKHTEDTDWNTILSSQKDMNEFLSKKKNDFMKDDMDKPLLSLIEPHFIVALGDVLTMGAQKYDKNNWKKCEDMDRYKDALLRHTYAYLSGEQIDNESGLEHLAHCAANIMFLQYFNNKDKN